MRVAICSSLQGAPEEFSPGTPVDCYRLSGRVYNLISDMYPNIEFGLFNRDDFVGQGDAYIALREATVAWGATVAVHIHQDAGGEAGARGWHVIYTNPEALGLANELVYAISKLPSPMRYGGAVNRGIAPIRKPLIAVLVEAGFYTSEADEAIGLDAWGEAIARGVSNYLQHHWGLSPVGREEEEEMPRFSEVGKNTYTCARIGKDNIMYIHAESAADVDLDFYGIQPGKDTICVTKGAGGWSNKSKWYGADYKVSDVLPGFEVGRVTIHAPCPLAIEVG